MLVTACHFPFITSRISLPLKCKFFKSLHQRSCFFTKVSPGALRISLRRTALSAMGSSGERAFDGRNIEDLKTWLEIGGIETKQYGTQAFKSLDDLLQEVEKGESLLAILDGAPVRRLQVLNLLVSTYGSEKVLEEEFQVRPSGAVRRRGLPLSEKLLPGEDWREGVGRAIKEELGSVLPDGPLRYKVDDGKYRVQEESWVSNSYPGLLSISRNHVVPVEVPGLPREEQFVTYEDRSTGVLESHWRWVEPGMLEAST